MKKLFLSIFLLTTLHIFAQLPDSLIYIKVPVGAGGGIVNTKFLNTTTNILSLKTVDSTKQLYIADTVLGGQFNLYTGNDAVDTAIVFQDSLGRKWKRNIINGALDIRWFGAQAAFFDSYYPILKAINYNLSHKGTYVYIPNIGTYFYSSQTFIISGNAVIKGDVAPVFAPTSWLLFPANKVGIKLLSGQLTMSDVFLNKSGSSIPDSTAHGFELHSTVNFTNVSASGASGDNLHIDACYANGTNADQSTFNSCAFHGALNNGVFITGCDANIMVFTNCLSSDNNHWGYYNNGFLGNTFVQCQGANNGKSSDVVVMYNGRGYVARNLIGTNNINQKPDAGNLNFWAIAEGYGTRNAWDSTKNYYSGGAFASVNPNAYDQYLNCYSEGYQSPSMYEGRTQVLNGIAGAGQTSGAKIATVGGVTNVVGSINVQGNSPSLQGNITAANSINTQNFFGVNGGGLYFADGYSTFGTGLLGGIDGVTIRSQGKTRFAINPTTGYLRLADNAATNSIERLQVDGNISLNGKMKIGSDSGLVNQVLISQGATGLNNKWVTLDTSNIPQLASNTLAINTKGRVDSLVFSNSGLLHAPATVSFNNKIATITQTLANQNPYTLLGRAAGTGVPSFLSSIDSNYAPTLAVKATVAQQIATIPKADSAFPGYAFKFDSVYFNGKYNIQLRVDSAKIASDTKRGLRVTGTGGTYDSTTGILNLIGGSTGQFVDTLNPINVRGLKTYIGSSSSDLAPQTEQLNSSGWTSTGWTGSFAAGFTNTGGNTSPLTTTTVILNNQLYLISYTITGWTTGSVTITVGGLTFAGITATGNQSATTTSTAAYTITPTSDFNGTIVPSLKSVGYSSPNAVWASSDLSNLFQIRIPINSYCIGAGLNALRRLTTGINNLAFGSSSQQNTTSGSGNMSFGTNALAANNTGGNNIAFGLNAGGNNTTGGSNSYLGYYAGVANTTGVSNTALGSLTLFNIVTGSNNTAVGNNAGRYAVSSTNLVNCSNCTFLGSDTKAGADGLLYAGAIGSGAVSPAVNNAIQIGNTSNQLVSITGRIITGSLTDNGADQLQVTGTAKITGQLNIPTGTLSTSAVNLAQMNAAITAGGGGSTAGLVDTLNAQNVRGTKNYIGSAGTDAAPQSEQLLQANFTSTGWTGTMAAGFTNGASNTTPLTNTAAAVSGQYYQLYWTVTGWTAGSFTVSFGGITQSGLTATGNSGGVPATSTATYSITPTATFNGTIVPSVKYIGTSNANAVWTSSDNLSNLFQLRIPANAYSAGLGQNALRRITTGTNNLAIGGSSQQNTTSGSGNVSVGTNTLAANNTGANNTVIGLNAGGNNTSGYNNAYIGNYAGSGNTTGYNNVSIGGLSLLNATTAMGTTAIGNDAGRYIGSGSTALTSCTNCTFLGQSTRAGADGLTNVTAIGNGAISPSVSNSIQLGNTSVTNVVTSGTVTLSDAVSGNQAVSLNQLNAAVSTSGAFTPTLTNVTNVVSSTPGSCVYVKTGNIVTCRIVVSITPNATGATVLNISLPFTTATATQSNIATLSIEENGGTSYITGKAGVNSTTTLQVRYLATSTATGTCTIIIPYQL